MHTAQNAMKAVEFSHQLIWTCDLQVPGCYSTACWNALVLMHPAIAHDGPNIVQRLAAHHVQTLQPTGICCWTRACTVAGSVFRLLASVLRAQAMQHSSALDVCWEWELPLTSKVTVPENEVRLRSPFAPRLVCCMARHPAHGAVVCRQLSLHQWAATWIADGSGQTRSGMPGQAPPSSGSQVSGCHTSGPESPTFEAA